jgi:hypothetical protein
LIGLPVVIAIIKNPENGESRVDPGLTGGMGGTP